VEFAKEYAECVSKETELHEIKRSMEEKRCFLMSNEGDGSHGIDISAHAFKQILERLEMLANENDQISKDCINVNNVQDSKFKPSNLKSFVIALIANAKKKGCFSKEASKNTAGGFEYRYNIEIKKWSDSKNTLQFVCIVENNNIKTGYFNWLP